MKKKPCPLYKFMDAAKGNWRNSVFVECGDKECWREDTCAGFLLAFASDGRPAIMSVESVRALSGSVIEPTECIKTMDWKTFETLFSRWLDWETDGCGECVLSKSGYTPRCLIK